MPDLARRRAAVAIGLVVCIVIPLASWLVDGRGRFAYAMYASTVTYRLELASVDEHGVRRAMDPGEVAGQVSPPAAPFLTGAEDFHTVAQIDALRAHLADVGRAACRIRPAATIEVTLHERALPLGSPSFDAEPERIRSERIPCSVAGHRP